MADISSGVARYICVAGRMRSHPWSGAGPHTLFHTAECIQITVNPKCQRQIPDSSTRSCHIRSTLAALQPLQQFKTDFKISLSIPEAYHELAISLRFVCRSRAGACRGMFRCLVSDFSCFVLFIYQYGVAIFF